MYLLVSFIKWSAGSGVFASAICAGLALTRAVKLRKSQVETVSG